MTKPAQGPDAVAGIMARLRGEVIAFAEQFAWDCTPDDCTGDGEPRPTMVIHFGELVAWIRALGTDQYPGWVEVNGLQPDEWENVDLTALVRQIELQRPVVDASVALRIAGRVLHDSPQDSPHEVVYPLWKAQSDAGDAWRVATDAYIAATAPPDPD